MARETSEMNRHRGIGLNMRLSKEKTRKLASRTGQEKIMGGDTYKHEEEEKDWFYKREDALLLTAPASAPNHTAISA